MTDRDTIIKLAREAGFETKRAEVYVEQWTVTRTLERFAALVAAAEREAMMQLFTDPENQPTQHDTVTVEYMQREIAAEREACARVCAEVDLSGLDGHRGWQKYTADLLTACAAAIRARGQA